MDGLATDINSLMRCSKAFFWSKTVLFVNAFPTISEYWKDEGEASSAIEKRTDIGTDGQEIEVNSSMKRLKAFLRRKAVLSIKVSFLLLKVP